VIVTYITLPGTLILGSAPAGGVIPITVTPVMLTAKVSSASGISSYIKNKFDTKLINLNYSRKSYTSLGRGVIMKLL
jgi:hypothetical protein